MDIPILLPAQKNNPTNYQYIYIYVYVYIYVFIYISSSVLLFFFWGGYSYTIYYIFLIRCARVSVKSKRPSVFLEGEDEGAFLRTGPQFGLLIWLDPRPKKAGTSWKVMGKSWENHGKIMIVRNISETWWYYIHMGMGQYLLIPFLVGWTSIYQLFWCSPGVQGFDTLPYYELPKSWCTALY